MEEKQDKASMGVKILSFLIPLVGLIIFLSNKKERPEYAKGCGIAALIGFIVGFVLVVPFTIIFTVLMSTGAMILGNASDALKSSTYLTTAEISEFNSKIKGYEGKNIGAKVYTLLYIVNDSNKTNSHTISVKYNGVTANPSNLMKEIETLGYYEVRMKYSSLGYINEIEINSSSIFSNSNSTSNTVNTMTNTMSNTVTNTTTNTSLNTVTNTISNTTTNTVSNSISGTNTISNTTANSNTVTNTTVSR